MCHTNLDICKCCKQFNKFQLSQWKPYSQFNFHQDCGRVAACTSRVYSITKFKCLACSGHLNFCSSKELPAVVVVTHRVSSVLEENKSETNLSTCALPGLPTVLAAEKI